MSRFFIKGSNSTVSADSADYLLRKRIIFINDAITPKLAAEVTRDLLILGSESDKPITIVIDSPGGNTDAGLAIIDMMRIVDCPIKCFCTCLAASMAAVIFTQGDERLMLEHARLMLHETKVMGDITGGSETLREITKRLGETDDVINELISRKSGKTKKEIAKLCSFDNFMTAEQAIKLGFADKTADRLSMIMEEEI